MRPYETQWQRTGPRILSIFATFKRLNIYPLMPYSIRRIHLPFVKQVSIFKKLFVCNACQWTQSRKQNTNKSNAVDCCWVEMNRVCTLCAFHSKNERTIEIMQIYRKCAPATHQQFNSIVLVIDTVFISNTSSIVWCVIDRHTRQMHSIHILYKLINKLLHSHSRNYAVYNGKRSAVQEILSQNIASICVQCILHSG